MIEITWTSAGGLERIVLAYEDAEHTSWTVNWTGGFPPTYWKQDLQDPDLQPIQKSQLPPEVSSRFQAALEDLGRRAVMTQAVL